MKKNEGKITYPSKPKIKEIVMFVFSCVVLISTLIFLLLPTGIEMGNGTNSNVDQTIPGEGVIAIMAGLHALVVIGVILCVALIICWIVGFIVSTKLVLRKKLIPRWMYISSIILMSCYVTLIVTLIILLIVG